MKCPRRGNAGKEVIGASWPAAPMRPTHTTVVGVSAHRLGARERPQTRVLAPTLGKQKGGCQHAAWYITGSRE